MKKVHRFQFKLYRISRNQIAFPWGVGLAPISYFATTCQQQLGKRDNLNSNKIEKRNIRIKIFI